MRAINLFRGSRAVQRARLPLARLQANKADPGSASADEVGLRFLNGLETGQVLTRARKYAIEAGVPDPKDDDELYQYGKAIWTVMIGCVDPDDPEAPFFDSVEQMLGMLGRDEILLLCEMQEHWQQECSPMKKDFEPEGIAHAIDEIVGPNGAAFFLRLRPGLRWSLMRFMAVQLVTSPAGKSIFGWPSTEDSGKQSESSLNERATVPAPAWRRTSTGIRRKAQHWRWNP